MKLKEYLSLYKDGCSFDCADDYYDVTVTVDYGEDFSDDYPYLQKATDELLSKVEVVSLLDGGTPVCNFTELIKHNRKLFENFIKENWKEHMQYALDDEDELYCELIKEFDNLLGGRYGESSAKLYYELFMQCR